MGLFHCTFDYVTAHVRGWGEMLVMARDADEAEIKAKMRAGAWSEATNVRAREVDAGIFELSHKTEDAVVVEREARERGVAPRYMFTVAAKADVVAVDRWQAYKKLANMVKQDTPPPSLQRKVVEQTPVDDVTHAEANAIFKRTQFLAGGAARPK